MRSVDLARKAGISVQSVRNYERQGYLPRVSRTKAGYRQYGAIHLEALLVSRALMAACGNSAALHMMDSVHRGRSVAAFLRLNKLHAKLYAELGRAQVTVERFRTPLEVLGVGNGVPLGEAARRCGVKPTTLRHWVRVGAVKITRNANRYALFDDAALYQVRKLALFRAVGYLLAESQRLAQRTGGPEAAERAAQVGMARMHERLRRLIAGGAYLWDYSCAYAAFSAAQAGEGGGNGET